jgi:hypothetical protein
MGNRKWHLAAEKAHLVPGRKTVTLIQPYIFKAFSNFSTNYFLAPWCRSIFPEVRSPDHGEARNERDFP